MPITQQEALERLNRDGALDELVMIIKETYAFNAGRFEHGRDDATTFGINMWRNVLHRALETFVPEAYPGVSARQVRSALEIACDGLQGRSYKIPFTVPSKIMDRVEAMTWDSSEAKLRGAVQNSDSDPQLAFDQDPDNAEVFAGPIWEARGHWRIVHTGDPVTGQCMVVAGMPRDNRDGGPAWLCPPTVLHNGFAAAEEVSDTAAGMHSTHHPVEPVVPPARFDEQATPNLDHFIRRRPDEPLEGEEQ